MRFFEGLGTREILIGVGILVAALLVAVPLINYMTRKSRRAEVPLLVDAIREAELAQGRAFAAEGYISADWAPRAPTELTSEAVPWSANEGWTRLGWEPAREGMTNLRGAYKVAATREGFTITGRIDVDGDGEHAVYEADQDTPAHPLTEAGVY